MNLEAWAGYWFWNAATKSKRAALFSSYGLIEVPPGATPSAGRRLVDWFWEFFA
jgi:hypothetical protein